MGAAAVLSAILRDASQHLSFLTTFISNGRVSVSTRLGEIRALAPNPEANKRPVEGSAPKCKVKGPQCETLDSCLPFLSLNYFLLKRKTRGKKAY